MPVIGKLAFFAFVLVTTIVAYSAASLRSRLHGRQRCRRWFAFAAGTMAGASVFVLWTGVHGLGAAKPGLGGAAFGLFAGLVWGGVFSGINSLVLWRAFDSPARNYLVERDRAMNTEIVLLISRAVQRLRSFRPSPGFVMSGALPWTLFLAAIALPVLWAYGFCLLTWWTEGAPGVPPVLPIKR